MKNRFRIEDDISIIKQFTIFVSTIRLSNYSSKSISTFNVSFLTNSIDIEFDVIDSINIRQTFVTIEKIIRDDMIVQSKFSNQQRIELTQIIVNVIRDVRISSNNDDDDEENDENEKKR